MSKKTQEVVKGQVSLEYVAEITGYSLETIRRWAADPEAERHTEPAFAKMLYLSQFANGDAAEFGREMCHALRPDLIPKGQA